MSMSPALRGAPRASRNYYRQHFTVTCPNNGEQVRYRLRIASHRTLMVEDIQAAVAGFSEGFHEPIADALFARFGGSQTLRAWHHGTLIVTTRGARA